MKENGELKATIAELKEWYRQRVDLHRTEKQLTLRIKAIERRSQGRKDQNQSGPQANRGISLLASIPLAESRALIKKHRLQMERHVIRLAKLLPVWPWVESINGFGPLGLGQIIAETGDLNNYDGPAKVWKRMGLAKMSDGIQRRVKGAAALEHGYSPERRSLMWCIGDSMIKAQNCFREVYLARKAYEEAETQAGHHAEKVERDGMKHKKFVSKENNERVAKGWLPINLIHLRAKRYMEKELLKELWRSWRTMSPGVPNVPKGK